tara:strand:+ start:4660 stop:6396 length:1737 start_codon:yes stop_codon:yes gene_type:complete
MAFQVSPGVEIKEIDATNVVPAVSTTIGGFAGAFNWGPADQVKLISSENGLVEEFGKPDNNTFKHFFVAASFLKYGNALKVVRTVGSDAKNAVADGTSTTLIQNEEVYDNNYANGSLNEGHWVARYPGVLGNSIKVGLITAGVSNFSTIEYLTGHKYSDIFDAVPGTSEYGEGLGLNSLNDELHVVVLDEDGGISGTPGTVLESYAFLSQASDAKKSDGTTNFYKEVINSNSEWIFWADHSTSLSEAGSAANAVGGSFTISTSAIEDSLGGGVDDNDGASGGGGSAAKIVSGLDLLSDSETVDVSLLFAAPDANGANTIAAKLIAVAGARKDCMAFISPPIEDTVGESDPVTQLVAYSGALQSSSYAAMDSGALYIYDKYNDVFRYIGGAGHQAGLCANAAQVADAWFSPAGFNRGNLVQVTKLAFNPNKAQRDELYKANINPIVSLPGQGTVLFGDKTLLKRPSAFDRINVRRLFIVLEKAIATAAKSQLFEFNDEFTRAQFRNLVEPFLRDVKGRRGLTDFLVVCDTTNNTGQVIDSNRFVADIFIKPSRSINFITLNFIATRTGVEFSEVAGSSG